MAQQENRGESRVRTALPVILESTTGVTRDLSASGAYFWAHGGLFIAGDQIRFAVQIRRPAGKMTLMCRGHVVRTEEYEAMLGVAVRITESAIEPI
jgi:hypothetical protein